MKIMSEMRAAFVKQAVWTMQETAGLRYEQVAELIVKHFEAALAPLPEPNDIVKLRAALLRLADEWESAAADATAQTVAQRSEPDAYQRCQRLEAVAQRLAQSLRAFVERELP